MCEKPGERSRDMKKAETNLLGEYEDYHHTKCDCEPEENINSCGP